MDKTDRLTDEDGSGLEVFRGNGGLICAHHFGQRRLQFGFVAMPAVDERVTQRPLVVFGRPVQLPHVVIDPGAVGVVAAGTDSSLMGTW